MLAELTAEHHAFRAELCAFLQAELTPVVRARHRDPTEHGGWSAAFRAAFRRKLGARGYIGMSWPIAYGGGGKDPLYDLILADELEYHRAPGLDATITYIPQTLLAFGSEEQKRTFLPRIRSGAITVFLGYSEPEAGSDLANLKTTAVEDGDVFILTGQKAYSSHAHLADYGFVAARTDPSRGRYGGISLFLVDMAQPGIRISTYRSIAGWDHPAVSFDRVPVPRAMLVGPLHEGWKALMAAIDFERAIIASPGLVDRQLDRLLVHVLTPAAGGLRPADDPLVQDRLVTLAIEAEAARLYAYQVAARQARGERPQHETSLALLLKREAARLADQTGADLLGPSFPLQEGSAFAPCDGAIEQEYREHVYFHFAAGGFDITRNVIATRGLRLPRA